MKRRVLIIDDDQFTRVRRALLHRKTAHPTFLPLAIEVIFEGLDLQKLQCHVS